MEATQSAWNVAHGLVWTARRRPDKVAIRDGRRALTYRALNEQVKKPRIVEFLAELPRTTSGKIAKQELVRRTAR